MDFIHWQVIVSPYIRSVVTSLTLQTDIWLVVSVPVLSEQITEVQPSVSTEGRLRTMAFFLAILLVPSAKQVVMTAGRPEGKDGGCGGQSIFMDRS